MPPKGRRASQATMPLTKTIPASISSIRRCCSAGSRGQSRGAEAERRVVGERDGLVKAVETRKRVGDRAEQFLAGSAAESAADIVQDRGGVEVAGAVEAPAAGQNARPRDRRDLVCPVRRGWQEWPAGRPACLSIGSPTTSACMAATKSRSNSAATSSITMKRLAAMQDCPLLTVRASAAVRAAASRSACADDDEGVAAAEFEHGLLDLASGAGGHFTAGGLAAGKGGGLDARIVEHAR